MKYVVAVATVVAGCSARPRECPWGELCSPLTPSGIAFDGDRYAAVGGTVAITLIDLATGAPLAVPFTVDAGLGALAINHEDGAVITVRGTAAGAGTLRILDEQGRFVGQADLAAGELASFAFQSMWYEQVPDGGVLEWLTGKQEPIGVALLDSSGTPLVDTSMELTASGAQRVTWDVLSIDAPAGTLPLTVRAGDLAATQLEATFVDHIDSIAAIAGSSSSVAPDTWASVCFEGLSGGAFVSGLDWVFTIDGVSGPAESAPPNCAAVRTTKTSGTVTVTTTALGMAATVSLPVASR